MWLLSLIRKKKLVIDHFPRIFKIKLVKKSLALLSYERCELELSVALSLVTWRSCKEWKRSEMLQRKRNNSNEVNKPNWVKLVQIMFSVLCYLDNGKTLRNYYVEDEIVQRKGLNMWFYWWRKTMVRYNPLKMILRKLVKFLSVFY